MRYVVAFSCIILLLSCDNDSAWDCLQKQGEKVTFDFSFDSTVFDIVVFDDINVVLHNSNNGRQRFELQTGKNLLPEINLEMDNGILSIKNSNSCRFVRPSNNVELHVFTDTLRTIEKRSYGNITTMDQINYSMTIFSYVPGEIELSVNSHFIGIELFALTNVKLEGNAYGFGVYVNTDTDGIIRAEQLIAQIASLVHDGHNSIHVNAEQEIIYYLWNAGDIHLYQEPQVLIEAEKSGSGKIIRAF